VYDFSVVQAISAMEPIRILLTTTSYQDISGPHHELLESTGAEIIRERGPLSEARMLELVGDFDAILCGDDMISRAVLEKAAPEIGSGSPATRSWARPSASSVLAGSARRWPSAPRPSA